MLISQINALPPGEIAHRRAEAATRSTAHFVFPHRLASGEIRMVDVHSSPIEESGRALLFSVIHDVTEPEHREAQLRQAAAVFENTAEAVVITDANGIVRRINPAYTALTGLSPQDVVGRHAEMIGGSLGGPGESAYRRHHDAMRREHQPSARRERTGHRVRRADDRPQRPRGRRAHTA
jgi:PAS domain S-box-containing protein